MEQFKKICEFNIRPILHRFLAKVIEINKEEGQVLVHFSGWGSRFDELIEISGDKLRFAIDDSQHRYRGKISRNVRLVLSMFTNCI